MLRKHIQPWMDWLKHAVTEPRDELNRWQAAARFTYDLGVHGWKALNRDDAPQMAAALSFRTLFALVPVVIVSAVLIKTFQGLEGFKRLVGDIVSSLGLDQVSIRPPAAVTDIGDPKEVSLAQWLGDLVSQLADINLAALGWVGFAVVVYSAIGLMVTIENSFNKIYGAPEGRYWSRRVPMYWTVLTLGPSFIVLTLFVDRQFSELIDRVAERHAGLSWLLVAAKFVWGFLVAWLFMFAVYKLLPNTKVLTKAALAGGFIAAAFLTLGKNSLGAYFNNALAISSLYGALGSIPLFMFWVYLMWLVVLFGLEVSATVQMVQGRHLEELEAKRPQNGLVDPAAVLSVMEMITERFNESRTATSREITDETLIAEGIVCQIVERLLRAGLIHRVDREDGAITLARPPELIPADRLIEIGYQLVDEGGVGRRSPMVQRLREAQKRLAEQTTMASLLSTAAAPAAPVKP